MAVKIILLVLICQVIGDPNENNYPFERPKRKAHANKTWTHDLFAYVDIHRFLLSDYDIVRLVQYGPHLGSPKSLQRVEMTVTLFDWTPLKVYKEMFMEATSGGIFNGLVKKNLRRYAEAPNIWAIFRAAEGPMGEAPMDIQAIAEGLTIVRPGFSYAVMWSTGYPTEEDAPLGYGNEHINEMKKALKYHQLRNFSTLIEFEIAHASHSADLLREFFPMFKFILFRSLDRTDLTERRIDFKVIRALIKEIGIERIYLDVSDSVKMKLLAAETEVPDDVSASHNYKRFYLVLVSLLTIVDHCTY